MKNIILISMLLVFQSACTLQASSPAGASAMLNYVDLAAEISVEHEIIETTAAVDKYEAGQSTD